MSGSNNIPLFINLRITSSCMDYVNLKMYDFEKDVVNKLQKLQLNPTKNPLRLNVLVEED